MQSRAARLILLGLFLVSHLHRGIPLLEGRHRSAERGAPGQDVRRAAQSDRARLLDLRAAQLGYAAARSAWGSWIGKVAHGLETRADGIQALRAEATASEAQAALDAATAALNDFAKSDKRAVDTCGTSSGCWRPTSSSARAGADPRRRSPRSSRRGTPRSQARESAVSRSSERRQVFALAAGAAAAVLVVLLLVPVARPAGSAPAQLPPRTGRAGHARELAVSDPVVPEDIDIDEIVGLPTAALEPEPALASLTPRRHSATSRAGGEAAPGASGRSGCRIARARTDFAGVASLCVDLARVVDTRALPSLLDRTAALLDASGIILWIADPDGRELNPIFAQGYPQQLVNRLGHDSAGRRERDRRRVQDVAAADGDGRRDLGRRDCRAARDARRLRRRHGGRGQARFRAAGREAGRGDNRGRAARNAGGPAIGPPAARTASGA